MNFSLLFTIITIASSAVLPKAEAEIDNNDQLVENITNQMQKLMRLSAAELESLSLEEFDKLLDEIFTETESTV